MNQSHLRGIERELERIPSEIIYDAALKASEESWEAIESKKLAKAQLAQKATHGSPNGSGGPMPRRLQTQYLRGQWPGTLCLHRHDTLFTYRDRDSDRDRNWDRDEMKTNTETKLIDAFRVFSEAGARPNLLEALEGRKITKWPLAIPEIAVRKRVSAFRPLSINSSPAILADQEVHATSSARHSLLICTRLENGVALKLLSHRHVDFPRMWTVNIGRWTISPMSSYCVGCGKSRSWPSPAGRIIDPVPVSKD
jgi:hypothetical protein